MKRFAEFLETSPTVRAWVRLNQSATIVALVVAVGALTVSYIKFNEDKLKSDEDRISKAWDTVTKMAGKDSNGGQVNAIQILVKNGITLDKIDLRNTYLAGANLKGASMRAASLNGANLDGANLQGADLSGANLDGAQLHNSDLGGVTFDGASFTSARLAFAKVDVSIVLAKSLKNTDLTGVKFVLEDSEGNTDFGTFGDTIAEAPNADGRQRQVDQSCGDSKHNAVQDRMLPIKLPTRPCGYAVNYQKVKAKTYEYSGY